VGGAKKSVSCIPKKRRCKEDQEDVETLHTKKIKHPPLLDQRKRDRREWKGGDSMQEGGKCFTRERGSGESGAG